MARWFVFNFIFDCVNYWCLIYAINQRNSFFHFPVHSLVLYMRTKPWLFWFFLRNVFFCFSVCSSCSLFLYPWLASYFTSFLQMILSEVVQRFAFLVFFIWVFTLMHCHHHFSSKKSLRRFSIFRYTRLSSLFDRMYFLRVVVNKVLWMLRLWFVVIFLIYSSFQVL